MFAVIKTGGKQYKVVSGNVLSVEKLAAAAGDTVQFNDVLMLGAEGDVTVGAPLVADAGVQAEVLDQTRGPKTISFKRRRRKSSSARRKGHRQDLTVVRITEILANGADKSGVAAALGAGSAPRAIEAAAPAPKAEKKAAPKKEAKAEAPAEAPAAGGAAPANLTDAPEASDKLTTFAGVGPKMAEKLNALGVHNFAQIAAWTEAEAAWIDEQAGLKGKIIADDWIGQAKAKAEEN